MFDNLRQQSMDESDQADEESGGGGGASALRERGLTLVNTLTPFQRFVLALMLFLNVSVLGCAALLVFGKIAF